MIESLLTTIEQRAGKAEKAAAEYADARMDHWINTASKFTLQFEPGPKLGTVVGVSCRVIAYKAHKAGNAIGCADVPRLVKALRRAMVTANPFLEREVLAILKGEV